VGVSLLQYVARTLEERLSRRLQEMEVQLLVGIVRRFIGEVLPPARIEEISTEVYARHFDADELREMLRFHRSAIGQKMALIAPRLAADTAQATAREFRRSPALPRLFEELRRAFPVLGPLESP
jgi:hypothetical protein